MRMKKWNYSKRIYEEYIISPIWHTPLIAELDEVINCAGCGKELPYGDCYTSLTIHTDMGMGYPVCELCYAKEWTERRASDEA